MTDSPVCQWAFVICEGTHVKQLTMQGIGLEGLIAGTVTQALSSLTFLTYLYLYAHQPAGPFPPLPALTSVPVLDPSANQLTGTIPALFALRAVSALDL
eukprot:gene12845-biopygen8857